MSAAPDPGSGASLAVVALVISAFSDQIAGAIYHGVTLAARVLTPRSGK